MIVAHTKETPRQLEDALAYLPRRGVTEYQRSQIIYDEQHPSRGLSLIIEGRVKVTTTMNDGSRAVTGIYFPDEFFGEEALLGTNGDQAMALEKTTLMTWSRAEIEAQIDRQPRLGMALIQKLVGRCLDFEERLQSLALNRTPERVAMSLIRFARSGTRESDGAVRIPPMTHELLSGYIGTSREIVTLHMNHLRQQGFLRYSRKAIQLYPEALAEHLRSSKTS